MNKHQIANLALFLGALTLISAIPVSRKQQPKSLIQTSAEYDSTLRQGEYNLLFTQQFKYIKNLEGSTVAHTGSPQKWNLVKHESDYYTLQS